MGYKTQGFTAVQTTDLIGSEYKLSVAGEVQTLKSNEVPHLAEARPPGINPTELILELTIKMDGLIGGDIVMWRPVTFSKHISADEYRKVMIRQGSHVAETISVAVAPS